MDSRFELKVEFSIYGKSYPWECSLNWTAEDGDIDCRIKEFFLSSHDEAYGEWCAKQNAFDNDRIIEAQRLFELKELQRLKSKYPNQ